MLRTKLTDRFSLDVPIVGAPMAGASGAGLAAAVSLAGAMGMVGVGSAAEPEWIAGAADDARNQVERFGMGLMAATDRGDHAGDGLDERLRHRPGHPLAT